MKKKEQILKEKKEREKRKKTIVSEGCLVVVLRF